MNDAMKQAKSYQGTDPILEEMWRIKDKLSAARGHDVHRLFDDARKKQGQSGHRIVNLQARREKPTDARKTLSHR